jgi:hypothetical protein
MQTAMTAADDESPGRHRPCFGRRVMRRPSLFLMVVVCCTSAYVPVRHACAEPASQGRPAGGDEPADLPPSASPSEPSSAKSTSRAPKVFAILGASLFVAGTVLPPLLLTGASATEWLYGRGAADCSPCSGGGAGSDPTQGTLPFLIPYAGPFIYIRKHPDTSVAGPLFLLGLQLAGTGFVVTSLVMSGRGKQDDGAPALVATVLPGGGLMQVAGRW